MKRAFAILNRPETDYVALLSYLPIEGRIFTSEWHGNFLGLYHQAEKMANKTKWYFVPEEIDFLPLYDETFYAMQKVGWDVVSEKFDYLTNGPKDDD